MLIRNLDQQEEYQHDDEHDRAYRERYAPIRDQAHSFRELECGLFDSSLGLRLLED